MIVIKTYMFFGHYCKSKSHPNQKIKFHEIHFLELAYFLNLLFTET